MVEDGVETPAALMLGRQLDFLNKELISLQGEMCFSICHASEETEEDKGGREEWKETERGINEKN